jgi:hypothetical protein
LEVMRRDKEGLRGLSGEADDCVVKARVEDSSTSSRDSGLVASREELSSVPYVLRAGADVLIGGAVSEPEFPPSAADGWVGSRESVV